MIVYHSRDIRKPKIGSYSRLAGAKSETLFPKESEQKWLAVWRNQ
jgi:hypothetical protein